MQGVARRDQARPALRRQENIVLLRRTVWLQERHELGLTLTDKADSFVEVQCVIGVPQAHLQNVASPAADGAAGRGSEPQDQQQRSNLSGELLVCRGDAGYPFKHGPIGLEEPAQECSVDSWVI